jgi:diguanylate cyclase (GGDEF)-like protein
MPSRKAESERPARRASDVAVSALARRYGDALRAGDSAMAEQVMDEALAIGTSPAAIQSLIIGPAMERIGDLWQQGAVSVADEHLATAISNGVLVRLFDALTVARAHSRERVLLAEVAGQHHVLGLRMVADVLEGAGFDVQFLGADVPVDALRSFLSERQPAVTGLGFGIDTNVRSLAEAVVAVHDTSAEPRLMLGGRAVPASLGECYPVVPSSLEVLSTVELLLGEPPQQLCPAVAALLGGAARPLPLPPAPGASDAVAERLAEVVEESAEVARAYIRQKRVLSDLALRDPVADMPNRRAFDDRIGLLTAPGSEAGALLMIDVDEFKQVNDTRGHDTGDQLLRRVGSVITQTIRPEDFAARIGGDEFAAILLGAHLGNASAVADRVRRAIAAKITPAVTVSIGVALLADDARATMLAADSALYEAKVAGRNRVAATP